MFQQNLNKTYYIFRHGETFATKENRWYWHRLYSAIILEEGKPSIIRLAKYLKSIKTDFNVSSPFLRCRQTVELINAETNKEFSFDSRIGERTFHLPGRYKKRILNFIRDMEESEYENILICTHAAVITVLIKNLSTDHISTKEKINAPKPGVLTIIKNGKIEEINFNETIV